MRKKISLGAVFFFLFILKLTAQYQANTWCFGDSAKLHFHSGGITIGSCITNTLEASASISDTNGNLLFYISSDVLAFNDGMRIYNQNDQQMQFGDSILSNPSVTQGVLILPVPLDSSRFYLFSLGFQSLSSIQQLFYSIVDITQNGGQGAVISKNNVLSPAALNLTEKLNAVKHANGRDWWVFVHGANTNTFYKYLVTPSGIIPYPSQSIGSMHDYFSSAMNISGVAGEMEFSQYGDKLLVVNTAGIINIFDFDRCTGILSNWLDLSPSNPVTPADTYYGCSFSPDGTKVYISSVLPHGKLFQFDLNSPTPLSTKTLIYNNNNDSVMLGQQQLGPNGRIYLASFFGLSFPNNLYDFTNTHLSVITQPNSAGLACSFQPYSFYLEGKRCYADLPNLPNYNLGAWVGNPCWAASEEHSSQQNISLFPNPSNEAITITTNNEKILSLNILNLLGCTVLENNGNQNKITIDTSTLSKGIYFVQMKTANGIAVKKFVKQ